VSLSEDSLQCSGLDLLQSIIEQKFVGATPTRQEGLRSLQKTRGRMEVACERCNALLILPWGKHVTDTCAVDCFQPVPVPGRPLPKPLLNCLKQPIQRAIIDSDFSNYGFDVVNIEPAWIVHLCCSCFISVDHT
jgi:hypothetical protein